MKVVIDTNVFVSGIFWSGPPFKIIDASRNHKIHVAVTTDIAHEYLRVTEILLAKYSKINLLPLIDLLFAQAKFYTPHPLLEPISRDPEDDKFIACAIAANTNHLISGDKDLLEIPLKFNFKIIKPSIFVEKNL